MSTQLGFYEVADHKTFSNRIFDRMAWHNAYALGYRKPNYPVPALRMLVDIEPDYVCVWELQDYTYRAVAGFFLPY